MEWLGRKCLVVFLVCASFTLNYNLVVVKTTPQLHHLSVKYVFKTRLEPQGLSSPSGCECVPVRSDRHFCEYYALSPGVTSLPVFPSSFLPSLSSVPVGLCQPARPPEQSPAMC